MSRIVVLELWLDISTPHYLSESLDVKVLKFPVAGTLIHHNLIMHAQGCIMHAQGRIVRTQGCMMRAQDCIMHYAKVRVASLVKRDHLYARTWPYLHVWAGACVAELCVERVVFCEQGCMMHGKCLLLSQDICLLRRQDR